MASVVPVYFAQIMPEVFNFSLACLAYFCWLYKEVAAPERSPRGTAWLFTGRAISPARSCWASRRSRSRRSRRSSPRRALGIFRLRRNLPPKGGNYRRVISCSFRLQAEDPLPTIAFVSGRRRALRRRTPRSPANGTTRGATASRTYFEFPFQTEGSTNRGRRGEVARNRDGATSSSTRAPSPPISRTTSSTSSSAATPGMLGYFFPGLLRHAGVAGRAEAAAALAVAGARVGARAGAHLRDLHAVHMERRRRRQPLFLRRLRRDAVPAAADRVDRRGVDAVGDRRIVRRADGPEPVRRRRSSRTRTRRPDRCGCCRSS